MVGGDVLADVEPRIKTDESAPQAPDARAASAAAMRAWAKSAPLELGALGLWLKRGMRNEGCCARPRVSPAATSCR